MAVLAEVGNVTRIYSQNIDGLDTRSKILKTIVPLPKSPDWPITIQLHGSLEYTICTKCAGIADLVPINHIRYVNLTCTQCPEGGKGKSNKPGKLRPGIVLYCENEHHDPRDHNPDHEAQVNVMNYDEQYPPDLLCIVGSSCNLPHINGLIKDFGNAMKARSDGSSVIWINPEDPPKSMMQAKVFDLVVKEDCQNLALWCLKGLAEQARR
jgi:NAD-dependent histone deacetylase SIR2